MKKQSAILILAMIILFSGMTVALAEEQAPPQLNTVTGPQTVTMDDIAKIDLPEGYIFADKESTVKIMESFGNPSSKAELGSVFPMDENQNWYIVFEYFDIGHIKDSDKDKINADDLLNSLKKGTEESNKERTKKGIPELLIKGWYEKPNYNEDFHSLVWCILAESEGETVLNYETRLLCREGYVAATLVCSETDLAASKLDLKTILDKYAFLEGKRYEDYVVGKDKLSDLGLAALIVGGSAVAVKKGLLVAILIFLKKGGFLLFAPLLALFKKRSGKRKGSEDYAGKTVNNPSEDNTGSNDNSDLLTEGTEAEDLGGRLESTVNYYTSENSTSGNLSSNNTAPENSNDSI